MKGITFLLSITFFISIFLLSYTPLLANQAEKNSELIEDIYDFGDSSSAHLTAVAWLALEQEDHEAVIAFTNRCIKRYLPEAKAMQKNFQLNLKEGEDYSIYWALNDVGTCLFIQGSSCLKENKVLKAKKAFYFLSTQLSESRCWDPNGWFWQPAHRANELLATFAANKTKGGKVQ
ncbi:MAG: hypothetical protein HQL32_18285 [Planctomycetes bacterium]|nr:hypothetical protein [Planctomycetota bacterium]